MPLFRLVPTQFNPDVVCPHCETSLSVVDWSTEYGDPLPGNHPIRCGMCSKTITVEVEVTTTYTARKDS